MKKIILFSIFFVHILSGQGYYPSYGPGEQWSPSVSTAQGFILFDSVTLDGAPLESGQGGSSTGTCDAGNCDIIGVIYKKYSGKQLLNLF